MNDPRLIALYLPQYHPIPENNEWWGTGFTEWTNVAAARPRFRGHNQPHIPGDLGFYDLRLPEAREAQAALARRYGIYGFCYYHYWFNGSRLLERPFDEVLMSGKPDFPFCLCWANESWTRAWDGLERQVLKKQTYSNEDARRHIQWLLNAFKDERYIRVDGKPIFIIYKLQDVPNVAGLIEAWQAEARHHGHPGLYICAMRTGMTESSDSDLLRTGVDAIVDFQPNGAALPMAGNLTARLSVLARKFLPNALCAALAQYVKSDRIVDYRAVADFNMLRAWPGEYTRFPCVFPSWDNSPRRKAATIIQNTDPDKYRQWLESAILAVEHYPQGRQIVFINAWNEWAEGCHLEPDRANSRGFLEATARALRARSSR